MSSSDVNKSERRKYCSRVAAIAYDDCYTRLSMNNDVSFICEKLKYNTVFSECMKNIPTMRMEKPSH